MSRRTECPTGEHIIGISAAREIKPIELDGAGAGADDERTDRPTAVPAVPAVPEAPFGPLDALDWLLTSQTGLRLSITPFQRDDPEIARRLFALATELDRARADMREVPASIGLDRGRSAGSETPFLAAADTLHATADRLRYTAARIADALALEDDPACGVGRRALLRRLAAHADGYDGRAVPPLERDALETELDRLERAVDTLHRARRQTGARYDDSVVREMDLEALEAEWVRSARAFGPLKAVLRRRLQQRLQAHAASGFSDPRRDLRALRAMRKSLDALADNPFTALAGPDRNTTRVRDRVEHTLVLRESLRACAPEVRSRDAFREAARALLRGRNDTLLRLLVSHRDAECAFVSALAQFITTGGTIGRRASLAELIAQVQTLRAERHRLVDRARWSRVRLAAERAGLGAIVEALEAGRLPAGALPATREAFARAWLPTVLANRPLDLELTAEGRSGRRCARNTPTPATLVS